MFEIDPRTFEAAVKQDKADLEQARVNVDEEKDEAERRADAGSSCTAVIRQTPPGGLNR